MKNKNETRTFKKLDNDASLNTELFWGDELAFRCGHRTGVIEGIQALAKFLGDNPGLLKRKTTYKICSAAQSLSVKDVSLRDSVHARKIAEIICRGIDEDQQEKVLYQFH